MNYKEFPVWRSIKERRVYKDSISANEFSRLHSATAGLTSPLEFEMECGVDEFNRKFLKGVVKTSVSLICQRCLEPLGRTYELPFHWFIIKNEAEEDEIGEEDDVILVEEDWTNVLDHLEDEILLELPFIPKHSDDENCETRVLLESLKPKEEEVRHPFAELSKLLKE